MDSVLSVQGWRRLLNTEENLVMVSGACFCALTFGEELDGKAIWIGEGGLEPVRVL